jgi:hypothetical protein
MRAGAECERCLTLADTYRNRPVLAAALRMRAAEHSADAFRVMRPARLEPLRWRDLWPFTIVPAFLYAAHVLGLLP